MPPWWIKHDKIPPHCNWGRLWLRGRASILFSEGHWFHFPGLQVEVSLGKILNLKTAPDVLVGTLHGSHRHHCMTVWITVSHFGQRASAKCPKYKYITAFCVLVPFFIFIFHPSPSNTLSPPLVLRPRGTDHSHHHLKPYRFKSIQVWILHRNERALAGHL